jgi:hypothetical protein
LVLEGKYFAAMLVELLCGCIVTIQFFLYLQKSGSFVVLAGFNEENEIFNTLAFLAGVMIWSQVCT